MRKSTPSLHELLGIELPLIQAPMRSGFAWGFR